jgi:hypothetical protein
MMLIKVSFAVTLVLFAIFVILIFLGEIGIKRLAKSLDVLYFIGSFFGFMLLAITLWGVFSL